MIEKRILKTLGVMAVLLALIAAPAMAESELDQSQTIIDSDLFLLSDRYTYQTFTAQKTGRLDHVSVKVGCCYARGGYVGDPDNFYPAPIGVQVEGSETFAEAYVYNPFVQFGGNQSAVWVDVPLDPAPFVEAGKEYQLRLYQEFTYAAAVYFVGMARSDVYSGGRVYTHSGGYGWSIARDQQGNDLDLAFKTYVTPSPLPDTQPQTTIDSGPGFLNTRPATFEFSSSESGSSFLCRLDGSPWVSCYSPLEVWEYISGSHTLEVRAISPSGISDPTPASRTFTFDNAPPMLGALPDITEEATGPSGAAVTFDATATSPVDPNPAVSCTRGTDPAVPVSSGDTFPLGTITVTCSATDNAGKTATDSFDVTVRDTTPPWLYAYDDFVLATSPTEATLREFHPEELWAYDIIDGTVDVECSPSLPVTLLIGTTTQFNCTATDSAGNTASTSFNRRAIYDWSEYLQPINRDGSSIFKLGSTVPVKFALVGASAEIKDATAKLTYQKVDDDIEGTVMEATSTATPSTGNLFRYDAASGQYVYNWSTKGLRAGTYRLNVDLGDNAASCRCVDVSLKK